jgi:chain length determinant protein tyrosine kinase EpsG
MLKKSKFSITRKPNESASNAIEAIKFDEAEILNEDEIDALDTNQFPEINPNEGEDDAIALFSNNDEAADINDQDELASELTLVEETTNLESDSLESAADIEIESGEEDAITLFSNGFNVTTEASEDSVINGVYEDQNVPITCEVESSVNTKDDMVLDADMAATYEHPVDALNQNNEIVNLFVGPLPLNNASVRTTDNSLESENDYSADEVIEMAALNIENDEDSTIEIAIDDETQQMRTERESESFELGHDGDRFDYEPEVISDNKPLEKSQPNVSKIGRLLYDLGKISRSDMKKILRVQKKHGLLFGDAALKLGLIKDADIQKVVAMQFNYHYLQAGQGEFSDDLVSAYAPFSKKVEAYRALRSQLMMRWFKKGHRALSIVSANRNEGISYLTANLGVVFSQLGARTLVIEANMRTPRQQSIFNIKENAGLSDILVGRLGIEAINEIESIPDLSVLTAGTVPPNPQELLGRTSFSILLKTLYEHYDVILIDTPPAIESADAQSAIELSEGALIVSRLNKTKQDDILELRNQIEMTGATVVGAVLNEY